MAIAFLLGAFGALVAEVLKRWQQWSDLPEDQFRALVKSVKFWAATLFSFCWEGWQEYLPVPGHKPLIGGFVSSAYRLHVHYPEYLLRFGCSKHSEG